MYGVDWTLFFPWWDDEDGNVTFVQSDFEYFIEHGIAIYKTHI